MNTWYTPINGAPLDIYGSAQIGERIEESDNAIIHARIYTSRPTDYRPLDYIRVEVTVRKKSIEKAVSATVLLNLSKEFSLYEECWFYIKQAAKAKILRDYPDFFRQADSI